MKSSILNKIAKIAIELLIVFIGVYLAFQLNNYKENQQAIKIKNNYYKILLKDFEATLNDIQNTTNQLEAFVSLIDDGKMPNPFEIRKLDLTSNMYILKSAFSSGYLEKLDKNYVKNLSVGSNHLARVANSLERYNNLIKEVMIQNNFDASTFYESDGTVKRKYSWCKEDLETIILHLKELEGAILDGAITELNLLIK